MPRFRPSLLTLAVALGLPSFLAAGCGDERGAFVAADAGGDPGDAGAAGPDAHYPVVEPSDPCLVAGYYFDGKSDCDVVRCPELTCECPSSVEADPGDPPPPPEEVMLSACVTGRGCLSLADCTRVCDPAGKLIRAACEGRVAAAGSRSCAADDDCLVGHCREESVGQVCVDAMQCAENGHCGAGFACLFDPNSLDPGSGFPTSLGTCSDGSGESLCYASNDCKYGNCRSGRCTGGLENEACQFNTNCASGFCRIVSPTDMSGSCVSGKPGGQCTDDGDCEGGLHCSSGVCLTGDVGQICERDDQCTSRICVSSRCRGGEPGSTCQEDADCVSGVCAGFQCSSGGNLAPCYDATDCRGGLLCARQVCTDGSKGAPCSVDTDCTVRGCVRGACSDGANGSACDADDDCTSNRCADPAGVEPGECTSGARGAHCVYADDCVSGTCSAGGTCN